MSCCNLSAVVRSERGRPMPALPPWQPCPCVWCLHLCVHGWVHRLGASLHGVRGWQVQRRCGIQRVHGMCRRYVFLHSGCNTQRCVHSLSLQHLFRRRQRQLELLPLRQRLHRTQRRVMCKLPRWKVQGRSRIWRVCGVQCGHVYANARIVVVQLLPGRLGEPSGSDHVCVQRRLLRR